MSINYQTMTYRQLYRVLYHGNQFTFAEMEAALELAKRGYRKVLTRATTAKGTGQRKFTRAAARHALREVKQS